MSSLPQISPELIRTYQEELTKSSSASTAKRKSIALNRFFNWAKDEGHIPQNPFTVTPSAKKAGRGIGLKTLAALATTGTMVVAVFLLIWKLKLPIPYIQNFAQGVVETKPTTVPTLTPLPATSAVNTSWKLYAKLKLTKTDGAPQVGSETLNFKLYNQPTGGEALYTSPSQTVTTDANGSTLISLDGVPSDLFFQNNNLYLEPGTTSTRLPVSTANSAANLGGFYPANPEEGAGPETIPVINSEGSLVIASQSPAVKATEGNLLIEGQAVTLKAADGSGGNIEINPDAGGFAHFLFEGNKGNFLNAQAPNLTSGSLYYGLVPNNSTGYYFIKLQGGSKSTTRFSVDSWGNTNMAGNLSTGGLDRLTSAGALQNITGYSQGNGNFTITQNPGDFVSVNKTPTSGGALSDVMTLTLDERGKPTTTNSDYSTLVLNRYDGSGTGAALKVKTGNAIFNGQLQLGQYATNPGAIGQGSLVFNTSTNQVYVWDGTSWVAVGSGSTIPFSSITSGTNTAAAMVVGSGASLTFSGTGTITASSLSCTDCLDFTEFKDALALDANTDIATAGYTLSTSGTGALNFASTGQVTFAGNVNATNGLDVTNADLTVGGTNFTVNQANGDTTTAGDVNVNGGDVKSTGALTITPGASTNLNISLSTTGDLAVNTNQLYVDTSAGYIGTGTTTPAALGGYTPSSMLQIGGSSSTNGNLVLGGGGTGSAESRIQFNVGSSGGYARIQFYSNSTYAGVIKVDSSANFSFYNNSDSGTVKFSIATNGDLTTPGNLAVNGGVINSTGTLTVNSATTNALTLDSGTTGAVNIGTGANSKTITIGNTSTNTTVVLTKGASGNITLTGFNCTGYTNGGKLTTDASGNISCGNDTGGGGGSSAWDDLTNPDNDLTLSMDAYTTTMNWASAGDLNAWTMSLVNDAGSETTQNFITIQNALTTQETDVNTEALLLLDNADNSDAGSTIVDNAILITNSGGLSPGIIDAIDASATGITNALNIGANKILGTTGVIDFTNFDVASTGNITVQPTYGIDTNAGGELKLGDTTATTISIGTTAASIINIGATQNLTRTINIGTGSGVDTIHIGDGATGADEITIGSPNAGNVSVKSNATLNLTGSSNSIIDFPNFDVATTGNITVQPLYGLDTNAAGELKLGDTTATTVSIGTTAATTLNLGASGSLARTINIGTGTGVDTIHIGDGATGADLITIGSTDAGASSFKSGASLTLTAGAASTWGTTVGNLDLQVAGDATTANVQIGAGGAGSTTPDLLVLDIKSDAEGAFAGTNGAMYYNADSNTFRCYQNGAWTDCVGGGGSSIWSDLLDPNDNLSLTMAAYTTTFGWTATGALDAWTMSLVNNAGSETPQNFVTIQNALTTQETDVNTEALLLLDNADNSDTGSTIVDNAILITNSGGIASGITDAIDVSASDIVNAINVGGNVILGTTANIDFTNFGVDGATGDITTAGDLAVNGNDITSTGDLTITPAGGQVIIPASHSLNIGDLSNVAYNSIAGASDTPATTSIITTYNDFFVGGNFELKGGLYLTGRNIYNVVGGVSTGTIAFASNPTLVNNYNSLQYGSWLVQNQTNNGIAALMVDQEKGGDIFSASSSGVTKFTIANNGNVSINGSGSKMLTVGGGAGGIDVGTVDPVYNIDGTKYATYLPGMTGVKEETTNTTLANEYVPGAGYRSVIDFKDLTPASDLWLFSQATNIKDHFGQMVVLLSPRDNARTWYQVDEKNYTLAIYSSKPTEISYRLSAPRFDANQWSNFNDNPNSTGFEIHTVPIVGNGEGIFPTLSFADFEIVKNLESGAYQLYQTISDGSQIAIEEFGSFANLIAANIKAGSAAVQKLAADRMSVKIISPLPEGTDVTVQIGSAATPSGKLAIQNSEGQEVAAIDNLGNATFSGTVNSQELTVNSNASVAGTLFADNIKSTSLDQIQALLTKVQVDQDLMKEAAGWNVATSTNSATLNQIAVSDLYVTNQAAINSLSITKTIAVGTDLVIGSGSQMVNGNWQMENTLNSLSAPLQIQSLAMSPIEFMAGKVRIETNGDIKIEGNLYVAGQIESQGLTIKDNAGNIAATLNASGSAELAQLQTQGIVIAGAEQASSSAIINGVITTNATAGNAIIPAGTSEITIKNQKISDYTLVYVTPTSSTLNHVLYVKSKEAGQFVVGFTDAINMDVSFNWWIIQTR
jgi:hypothetical protein